MTPFTLMVAVAVTVMVALAGCGSAPPPLPAPQQLFQDYINSTTVKNDEFTGVTNKADRIANFAAYYTRDDLASFLFSAYQCENAPSNQLGCPPDAAVTSTANAFGGKLYERNLLVRHHDGRLELMPLYLGTKAGVHELIDSTGRAYPGGLDDFRAHNNLLSSDDLVVLANPITDPTGDFQLRVVTGHTPSPALWPYLLIGILILIAAVAVVALVVIRRRRHS